MPVFACPPLYTPDLGSQEPSPSAWDHLASIMGNHDANYSPASLPPQPTTPASVKHELVGMFLHAAWGLKEVKGQELRSIPSCGDDQPSGAVPIHPTP
jgi:hypothetical protein